jgi:hypothetical protein
MTGRQRDSITDLARIHLDAGIEQLAGERTLHRERLFDAEIGLLPNPGSRDSGQRIPESASV